MKVQGDEERSCFRVVQENGEAEIQMQPLKR